MRNGPLSQSPQVFFVGRLLCRPFTPWLQNFLTSFFWLPRSRERTLRLHHHHFVIIANDSCQCVAWSSSPRASDRKWTPYPITETELDFLRSSKISRGSRFGYWAKMDEFRSPSWLQSWTQNLLRTYRFTALAINANEIFLLLVLTVIFQLLVLYRVRKDQA